MTSLLGGSPGAFLGMTVLLLGFAAFLTGQALAQDWRPAWQLLPCALLLAAADRFLLFALFDAEFGSAGGWLCAIAILLLVAAAGYFLTRARKMVSQYPWLYERAGPFGWRLKQGMQEPAA